MSNYQIKDDVCPLPKRAQTIEAYLDGLLSDIENEAFEEHLFNCEWCFQEIRTAEAGNRLVKEGLFKTDADAYLAALARQPGYSSITSRLGGRITGAINGIKTWYGNMPFAAKTVRARNVVDSKTSYMSMVLRLVAVIACAFILYGCGYGVYQYSLPPFYETAKLSALEKKNLWSGERSAAASAATAFANASRALLVAPQKRFWVFPYFEPSHTATAISGFRQAYQASAEADLQNECAFFLGKAWLMQAEPDSARAWFSRVLASKAVIYQKEAKQILKQLE